MNKYKSGEDYEIYRKKYKDENPIYLRLSGEFWWLVQRFFVVIKIIPKNAVLKKKEIIEIQKEIM